MSLNVIEYNQRNRVYGVVNTHWRCHVTKIVWLFTVLGIIIGASAGYFYRPPTLFIGQLPFDVVITRGANLKGLDLLYLETAKTSFDYIMGGCIAGAILGTLIGFRAKYHSLQLKK
jgi:hypothetical protein